jgi:hypothetical protein
MENKKWSKPPTSKTSHHHIKLKPLLRRSICPCFLYQSCPTTDGSVWTWEIQWDTTEMLKRPMISPKKSRSQGIPCWTPHLRFPRPFLCHPWALPRRAGPTKIVIIDDNCYFSILFCLFGACYRPIQLLRPVHLWSIPSWEFYGIPAPGTEFWSKEHARRRECCLSALRPCCGVSSSPGE